MMTRRPCLRPAVFTALMLRAVAAAAQTPAAPEPERRASEAAMESMSGHGHDAGDPHLVLSTPRTTTTADSARAAALVATIRKELGRFRDVKVAIAEGYEQFLPNVPQPVYHFTNNRYGLAAAFAFNPTLPTSLLYRRNAGGGYTLTGVMYTAPLTMSEAMLDRRIPLGMARWHRHVNWCLPRRGEEGRWLETRDGAPLFGPRSPIATEAECDAAGGRFVPHLFGWMVHVNAFESDDPAVIWGDHHRP
jgi:hypothetical protein